MDDRRTSLRIGRTTTVAVLAAANTQSPELFEGGCVERTVRIHTDVDCFIMVSNNPTATADSVALSAGSVEYFTVNVGDKIATFGKGTAGKVSITEML